MSPDVAVVRWWFGMRAEDRPVQFSVEHVAAQAFGIVRRLSRAEATTIGIAVRSLGFSRAQQQVGGKRGWYYRPTPRVERHDPHPPSRLARSLLDGWGSP